MHSSYYIYFTQQAPLSLGIWEQPFAELNLQSLSRMSDVLAFPGHTGRRRVVLGHTLNTLRHIITKKSHIVLSKFTILCWAAFSPPVVDWIPVLTQNFWKKAEFLVMVRTKSFGSNSLKLYDPILTLIVLINCHLNSTITLLQYTGSNSMWISLYWILSVSLAF